MPALPAVPSHFRVEFLWNVGSDANAITRLFFRYTSGPPTPAQCATWAADFQGDWANFFEPLAHPDVNVYETIVTDIASSTGAQGTFSGINTGTRSGSFLGRATCGLVNMGVARRYRGGKPRMYLPIGTSSDLDANGNWNSSFLSACATQLTAWEAAVLARSVGGMTIDQQSNVSYYHGFTVVTNPSTGRARNVPTPRSSAVVDKINTWTTNVKPGTQRRRNLHSR